MFLLIEPFGSITLFDVSLYFHLTKEFQTRCPYGKKTKLYKKAKIEKFAEYLLKDGLVSSLSSYSDYECEYQGQL